MWYSSPSCIVHRLNLKKAASWSHDGRSTVEQFVHFWRAALLLSAQSSEFYKRCIRFCWPADTVLHRPPFLLSDSTASWSFISTAAVYTNDTLCVYLFILRKFVR